MNNKNYNKEIGAWLAMKRKEKGLSQRQVADLMDVSKTSIGHWELGERLIFASNLIDYCKVIDADPSDLVSELFNRG